MHITYIFKNADKLLKGDQSISLVLNIKQYTYWKYVFNGKNHRPIVNNQSFKQIYMDMLEKLKMEDLSISLVLKIKQHTCWKYVFNGKKSQFKR